jgi:hypothetical protein
MDVAPVLDVAIAAIALRLGSTEAQSLIACLEGGIEVMNDGNDERLGTTAICAGQCTGMDELIIDLHSYAVEVHISEECKGCYMPLAYCNARNVNTDFSLDPAMKLVVG